MIDAASASARRLAGVEQRQLAGGTDRRLIEVRHGDTEQADALHGRQHQAHEFDARLLQQTVSCDRHRKAAASSNLAEVGEFDLHGDGSAECVRLFAPGPDFVCYGLDAGLDLIGCGEIPREGGLRAGGLTRAVGNDRAIVFAIRDAEIPLGRFAKMALQEDERLCPQIRARLNPSRCIFAAVTGPTPWNLPIGSDAMKSGPISGVMTNWPFGLRWLDASLARNLL